MTRYISSDILLLPPETGLSLVRQLRIQEEERRQMANVGCRSSLVHLRYF